MSLSRFFQQLVWRKPTKGNKEEENLLKVMGAVDLIAYGVGSCVGAGVFVSTGVIAANLAGPSVCLSFIFAGIAAGLSALCYAEFAARLPIAGGAYAYAYASMGELCGWFIGWNATLQYAFSAGSVAVSWANYVIGFVKGFGYEVPVGVAPYEINDYMQIYPLSLVIIILTTAIVLAGANESAKFNVAVTVWNVSLIVFVIIYGFTFVEPDNWSPFMPYSFSGTISGAGTAFFSYVGLDAVSCMSAETKNPQRDIPIGLMGTLFIAMALYSVLSLVISGMVNYVTLQQPAFINAPISQAFIHVDRTWAAQLVGFCSITTLTCTTLCCIMGQPRIFMPMSFDGLLWPAFGRINKRGVPAFSVMVTCVIAMFLAMFIKFDFMADAISLGTFISFTVSCSGMLIMRMADMGHTHLSSDKRLLPSRYSIMAILGFAVGSVIFAMTNSRVKMPLWGTIILAGFFVVLPALVVLYIWYFTAIPCAPDTFNCPLMPYIPLLGILVNAMLMAGLPNSAFLLMLVWVAAGVMLYFAYGFSHSRGHCVVHGKVFGDDEDEIESAGDTGSSAFELTKGKGDDLDITFTDDRAIADSKDEHGKEK
eukprot:comp12430_c0_seq1/m.7340 comp12430_c0_seq1/g.7340  ORF comp12430_c0_seq1/g.7340 comp12430_c0_seq1/m.7340 type:complete len:593 (-) comp12430_c0_seq1:26-1804(-)